MNTGEQLISDVAAYIYELVPVHIEKVKNKLSTILSKYHVKKVEQAEVHPDLTEKTQLFLSSKAA